MKIQDERKYHFDATGSFGWSFATSPDTFLYFAYGSNMNPVCDAVVSNESPLENHLSVK